ncbi:histidine phosphatase family protein [Mycetocola zhadangensis]|uniref:Histidine phosphatase family protein n=1 Tax=Mycetocola zhadangensis TaxID=1164595 RepID=A0A3L7J5M8_9MICO|nr:histidine phosphatase family protein [Mycetocola zhadangensis]RLQ85844.1 histidine phosphatase family protein [Mycetocola zhadangensis]GGE86338.1 fructose 1,6-bisphosphatase [Mycetocola zhadangensis]
MTLAFIRHGQTDWNFENRLQGSTDIPLNDTGRQQARDAVATLAGVDWEVIVSSPLSRARETASIIADGLGIELGPAFDELVERHYGDAEGATAEVIAEHWPDGNYPGLESIDAVVARATTALERVSAQYGDRNTLIVCHGTLIRYTLSSLAGREFDLIRNGSVATFERLGEEWRVLSVNDEPIIEVPVA